MAEVLVPATNGDTNRITADEIAVYDRQIRLWGLAAQERIRNAKILLVTLRAIGTEVAKNLVLAGIASLTVLDDADVVAEDLGAQFFLTAEDIGKKRAEAAADRIQKLNPRVRVLTSVESPLAKTPEYFSQFDIVIATDAPFSTLLHINSAARAYNKPSYFACSHGMYAFSFADLISHDYLITREQSNITTIVKRETPTREVISVDTERDSSGKKLVEKVTKRETYSSLQSAATGVIDKKKYNTHRRLGNISPLLSLIRGVWAFEREYGREPTSSKEDTLKLVAFATQCHSDLGLPGSTLSSEYIRAFSQNIGGELAPVAAIIGGTLSQEAINLLSGKEQPMQNMGLLDERGYTILSLQPKVEGNGY